jgi:hypothetical protein
MVICTKFLFKKHDYVVSRKSAENTERPYHVGFKNQILDSEVIKETIVKGHI